MPLSAGTRLGPYEVTAQVGAGGMGEVYRARDPRLGRDVAIKVLPTGLSTDPERLHRFEQEARAAAALNHPNILAVHDIGQHDGAPYIVSELLEGETLRTRLSGALPVRKAVDHAIEIARGLAAAHEKGIIHRDLKPENLFITADGHLKILDFGLAKLTQPDAVLAGASALPTAPPDTEQGTILGTLGYMSPEQVRGLQADARSDIFAFGAVLYEMLSGQRAFRKDTRADTISAILKEDPPDLPVADRHIPPALVRIVDRCLEKSPSARFQSAGDLGFALESLSSYSETIAASGAPGAGLRRNQIAWAIAAVAIVAALVLGAVTYLSRSTSDVPALQSTILPPPDTSITDRGGDSLGTPARRLALSPDGQRLAFTAAGPDHIIHLWVRRLDALTAQRLEGTEGAVYPFWSPDSRYIGFFSEGPPRRSRLMKIDVTGGPPLPLCELTSTNSTGGTWNRDGVILFGTFFGSPESLGIHRVSAAGGTSSPVSRIDTSNGEALHYAPYFLPDGHHFLYLALAAKGGPGGQYVGSLDSDERMLLMPGGSNAKYANGHLFFMRDTTLMAQPFDATRLELHDQAVPVAEQLLVGGGAGVAGAFTLSENGRLAYQTGLSVPSQLRWFDRDGNQLGLLGEPGLEGFLTLSPDGSRAAVMALDVNWKNADVWVYDVARGARTRFTFDATNLEFAPVWSPDGQRIVFASTRQGVTDLYVKSVLGTGAEELVLASAEGEQPISWSPDGRFLSFMRTGAEAAVYGIPPAADVWVLPLFGDRTPFAVVHTRFAEGHGRFSPDGRWMVYMSAETGRAEVYVTPFPGPGAKVPISTAGGTQPRWRRDGTEIFYVAGNRLMAAPVNGQGATFEVGAARPLFEIRPRSGFGAVYDVSPDGQRFLVNTMAESTSTPITLVVNWPALLKR
jgi:serine/threonine protein kinase/Tol biopolymer transport system component